MKDRIYKFLLVLLGYPIVGALALLMLIILYPVSIAMALFYPEKFKIEK